MSRLPLAAAAAALFVLSAGCESDDDEDDFVIIALNGTSASDFRSLADYLADPAIQDIFAFMARNTGSSPPAVEGRYLADGTITVSSVPGAPPGSAVQTEFCLGPPAGAAIEAAVIDPTVVDAGALSFIEGSGNLFTAYTAFKSVQAGPGGLTCEIHQVVVFSGRREADGSLSSLEIGFGIVGLLGDCGSLLVDQIQVSDNSTGIPTASCVGGATPADPARVLVEVDNFLVTEADVSINGAFVETVPALSSFFVEVPPGFTLSFDSVPPDATSEVLSGAFPADAQPAGRFSQYAISNQVGDDIYFAPLIANRSGGPVTVRVNVDTSVVSDCGCSLASSALAIHTLGYHFYDAPGLISADQTSVEIDEFPSTPPAAILFPGPFDLLPDSGSVTFTVVP